MWTTFHCRNLCVRPWSHRKPHPGSEKGWKGAGSWERTSLKDPSEPQMTSDPPLGSCTGHKHVLLHYRLSPNHRLKVAVKSFLSVIFVQIRNVLVILWWLTGEHCSWLDGFVDLMMAERTSKILILNKWAKGTIHHPFFIYGAQSYFFCLHSSIISFISSFCVNNISLNNKSSTWVLVWPSTLVIFHQWILGKLSWLTILVLNCTPMPFVSHYTMLVVQNVIWWNLGHLLQKINAVFLQDLRVFLQAHISSEMKRRLSAAPVWQE